jgi:glycerophosphoryl diester phosphodiesterase
MKDFILIGHRGACYYKPENTLASFRYALKLKCPYLESDVRLTKDKQVILMHDKTLERTTNGKGLVNKFTLKELKKLDAGHKEKIPTLQELINLVKNKVNLVIELKKSKNIVKKTLQIIKKNKIEDQILIVSFHFNYLKQIKKLNKNIKTGLLSRRPLLSLGRAKLCQANFIGVYYRFLTKNFIQRAHEHNFRVLAYERVDENINKKEIKRLIKIGLDGIALNKPIL